jgi:hypothetical protein
MFIELHSAFDIFTTDRLTSSVMKYNVIDPIIIDFPDEELVFYSRSNTSVPSRHGEYCGMSAESRNILIREDACC